MDKTVEIGRESLRKMDKLDIYKEWFWGMIKDYVGCRTLEVGCAIGIWTRYLIDSCNLLVSIDIVDEYVEEVKSRFAGRRNFKAFRLDIAQDDISNLVNLNIDTVVCLNVLEHIEDDIKALKNIYSVLNSHGRLILLVPAFSWLYGALDEVLGHRRRYRRQELRDKIEAAGFTIKKELFCNFFGIFGWFLNGKILRRPFVSDTLLKVFDKFSTLFLLPERFFSRIIGMSLLLVCEKKANGS